MKVYAVMYENSETGIHETMDVFDTKQLASEYIWDWNRRENWIKEGYNLDDFYWVEKELDTNIYTGIGH